MKQYRYTGTFQCSNGKTFKLVVVCNGFIQALILLTAKAINQGKSYQLSHIEDEKKQIRKVDDITKISSLLS